MADKKLNLRPLADRVIVEPLEQEEKTARGIPLPETAKDGPQEGLIVAVGPGRWDEEGKKRVEMEMALGNQGYNAKVGYIRQIRRE